MLALLLLTVIAPYSHGFPTFQALIPNGGIIRDPCDGVTIWPGVGHQAVAGGGLVNPFGQDFLNNEKTWNLTLCVMDSDGDGVSNGEELGDPDCVWTPESNPTGLPTGHPGVCEPWSDTKCLKKRFHICQLPDLECDAINNPDVLEFAVRYPQTQVPAKETTYTCMNFALPADQDYHVIADRGVIDNEFVMHHMIIFACSNDVEPRDLVNPLNAPYECGMVGETRCRQLIAGWSVGIPGVCHNENAGYKIGISGYKYALLQIHWNNPLLKTDYMDSSGMILYYTPILRPYNLGSLIIGEYRFSIPPGEHRYVVESECTSACSSQIMNSPIYVVGGHNHMHYMGREMETSYEPMGGTEQVIMDDPLYSYDNPILHIFETPLKAQPGDVFKTKCSFTSLRKDVTTHSGEATAEEMCFAFLFYYPKESIATHQCFTMMGLPLCTVSHETKLTEGCQIQSFLTNTSYFDETFKEILRRCETFVCRKECKTYIEDLRSNPCFQGKVKGYVESMISPQMGVNKMALYHSCDTELALEAVEPCTCTTQTQEPCIEYTGTSVSHKMSFSLLLMAVFVIHFN
ncbi:peptidyl-glycine alpha-amidating monooxygenase-like [Ylistrum balloti]|uniref:peptidyl-glycine alpha-amidating monooxygenase-like n=1 Tax=Ylistrum balloti TaxID=509963 RepID=UPI002905970E|nr:peptidyl-glycine alpha-amidating monooxygenase-like [Ylistrum balloti]